MNPHPLRVSALLLVSACATGSAPRVLHETKQSPPRSYERPANLAHPFDVSHVIEDGFIRVRVAQGQCVTTTEVYTRVQEVTLMHGRRIEGEYKESVERTDSPPHPCRKDLAGTEVSLMLPVGIPVSAKLDARGEALLDMPDAVLGKLSRSAHGLLSLGRFGADVPLDPLFVAYARRARADFGEITLSDVVSSSGRIAASELLLEVAVSPRNDKNEFGGAFLPETAFHFENVQLVPEGGGPAVPLSMAVERVEVARPGEGQLNVALLLDSSGSMRDNDPKREGRISGGQAVVSEVTRSGSVAVLDFGVATSPGMREARLLQDFTRDPHSLQTALHRIGESGGTPLYTSIADALGLISRRGGTASIVVLTDGEAEDADQHRAVIELARRQGVPLFAIGLGKTLDFADLRHLGLATNGGFAEVRDADKLAEAFRGVGIGLAYGRVRVFGRGDIQRPPAPGRYRVVGELVTADPDSKKALIDKFDALTILDGKAGSAQMTLAAGGGCNPDCYYDASCNVQSTGGGRCCDPVEGSIHGPLFADQCRAQLSP
jgi:hypothetical protein